MSGRRGWWWGAVVVCLSSCAQCQQDFARLGVATRRVQLVLELVAVVFGALLLLVVAGGLVTLVRNLRAPTARTRRWGRALGIANLALGVVGLIGLVGNPPRDPAPLADTSVRAAPAIVDASGLTVVEDAPPPAGAARLPVGAGSIRWPAAVGLSVVTLAWLGFGIAQIRVARR